MGYSPWGHKESDMIEVTHSHKAMAHTESLDRDFLGGPVAKTLRSQCQGPEFDPWSGNWILCVTTGRSCMP